MLPERSIRSGAPRRIETPPFFAIPICAGITNTIGRIAIDGHDRVKRPDGFGDRQALRRRRRHRRARRRQALGYVDGLIKACVFGLRTAEHIARR